MAIVINAQDAVLVLEHLLDRVTTRREEVMIERPHGEPVVLLPLDEFVALAEALVASSGTDPEDAELYSLDARRRRRDERASGTLRRSSAH